MVARVTSRTRPDPFLQARYEEAIRRAATFVLDAFPQTVTAPAFERRVIRRAQSSYGLGLQPIDLWRTYRHVLDPLLADAPRITAWLKTHRGYLGSSEPFSAPQGKVATLLPHHLPRPAPNPEKVSLTEVLRILKEASRQDPDASLKKLYVYLMRTLGFSSDKKTVPQMILARLARLRPRGINELTALVDRHSAYEQTPSWARLHPLRVRLQDLLGRHRASGISLDRRETIKSVRGGEAELRFLSDVVREGYLPVALSRAIDRASGDYHVLYRFDHRERRGESRVLLYVGDEVEFDVTHPRARRRAELLTLVREGRRYRGAEGIVYCDGGLRRLIAIEVKERAKLAVAPLSPRAAARFAEVRALLAKVDREDATGQVQCRAIAYELGRYEGDAILAHRRGQPITPHLDKLHPLVERARRLGAGGGSMKRGVHAHPTQRSLPMVSAMMMTNGVTMMTPVMVPVPFSAATLMIGG